MIYFITEASASNALFLPVLNVEMEINIRGLVLQAAACCKECTLITDFWGVTSKTHPQTAVPRVRSHQHPADVRERPVPAPGTRSSAEFILYGRILPQGAGAAGVGEGPDALGCAAAIKISNSVVLEELIIRLISSSQNLF